MNPVMTNNLCTPVNTPRLTLGDASAREKGAHHCHGSNFGVWMCSEPKEMKPDMICAARLSFSGDITETKDGGTYLFRSSKLGAIEIRISIRQIKRRRR